jgi:hypothetical protein
MDLAVEQMPDDWDETELAWYLVHRAELFTRTERRMSMRSGAGGSDGEPGAQWEHKFNPG